MSGEDGAVLADSYRFLRTVEHRLQLVEEEQTHALPTDAAARRRLARVLGFADGPSATATAAFDDTMRRCQSDVRIIHERLFFRPLLEAFAALDAPPAGSDGRDADVRRHRHVGRRRGPAPDRLRFRRRPTHPGRRRGTRPAASPASPG